MGRFEREVPSAEPAEGRWRCPAGNGRSGGETAPSAVPLYECKQQRPLDKSKAGGERAGVGCTCTLHGRHHPGEEETTKQEAN
jgi:hypothetical protein